MQTAAEAIPKKVIHKIIFESKPLLYFPINLLFEDILIIKKIKGTAATPFKTAENTSAFTGFIPMKLMIRPISVAIVMMP